MQSCSYEVFIPSRIVSLQGTHPFRTWYCPQHPPNLSAAWNAILECDNLCEEHVRHNHSIYEHTYLPHHFLHGSPAFSTRPWTQPFCIFISSAVSSIANNHVDIIPSKRTISQQTPFSTSLFHSDRLCQISWEVNVNACCTCQMVWNKLQGNDVQETLQTIDRFWDLNLLSQTSLEFFVVGIADNDWFTWTGNDYFSSVFIS